VGRVLGHSPFRQPKTTLTFSNGQLYDTMSAPSGEDHHGVMTDFNLTSDATTLGHTIPHLVERAAERYASKTAVICGGTELTYGELNARANHMARVLVRRDIGRGDLIGVVLNRSVELVVVLLAILKSGATYVPIAPDLPAERIRLMMDGSAPKLVVASASTSDALSSWHGPRFDIEEAQFEEDVDSSNLSQDVQPEDLAYVLFTSGSTGKPKGVQVTHGAVGNFLLSMQRKPGCDETDRFLAAITISFDPAVLDLFVPLISGAIVVVAESHHIKDPRALLGLMQRHAITMMVATPTGWQILLESGWTGQPRLRRIICGGEGLPRRLADRLLDCSDEVWNMYGPTEATVVASCWNVQRDADVIIGSPVANSQLYVLDEELAPVPVGSSGELYIGGACLARGYLNNPEMTRTRFIDSPFDDGRLYRTGDLASFLAPGQLSVIGRTDSQVKIRGHRIELGDIEATLNDHPEISAAVVICHNERLIAYCVRDQTTSLDLALVTILRPWATERLPAYMVPSFFVEIGEIPLSPNGKTDHQALPPYVAEAETEFKVDTGDSTAMTISELERHIMSIWSEVLGHNRIGVDDNFFQIGGDSLRVIQAQVRLEALLGHPVSTPKLFQHFTIRTLAAYLASQEDTTEKPTATKQEAPNQSQDIAIVSMSCRLPGGITTPEEYWELLVGGFDAISDVPKDRWDADLFYSTDPDLPGKSYCRRGGFLSSIDEFDASFFGITPREAQALDPAQHLMLETCWEGFERGGYTMDRLRGSRTGVFIGVSNNPAHEACGRTRSLDSLNGHAATGTANSTTSGRVSHFLGLEGPAMTVDTACSSSLVTTHLACSALRQGECDLAISGGVALLTPGMFVEFSQLRGLSPDGRCRAFSADTQGTGFAEGAATIVLKRLSDAQRDGDTIHAVLRGSAVNHDGHAPSLTTPNGAAQRRLIETALTTSGLKPRDIDYIEAHGTATKLGDPIEGVALAEVFDGSRPGPEDPLWIGSAKSNLGHTQAAAGVAGLLKIVLSLKHSTLPQTLHVSEPTPAVDWKGARMALVQEKRPWLSRADKPRRAGISAFGVSGTNAHVIVEEAPRVDGVEMVPIQETPLPTAVPVLLSATTDTGLRHQAQKLLIHLKSKTECLGDIAYSLATTRNHFRKRLAILAHDKSELLDELKTVAAGSGSAALGHAEESRVAMLFTGQGSQFPGMGRDLAQHYPVFRDALEEISSLFADALEKPLLDVMWAAEGSGLAALLGRTDFAQPALFALEVALWRLWTSWGVQPDVVLGHSIGELAAAHVAGVMDLPDACRLVAARGRLMQDLPTQGSMVSLEASDSEVVEAIRSLGIEDSAHIAAHNTPTQTVASGDVDAVEVLTAHFLSLSRKSKKLDVSHAFHSHHMHGMLEPFRAVAETVKFKPATLPIVSTLTGRQAGADELAKPDYWIQQARGAVKFNDGVQTLAGLGVNVFLELGPRPVLCGLGAACLDGDTMSSTTWLPSLVPTKEDIAVIQRSLAEMHTRHVPVDWLAYFRPFGCRRVPLPTHAFQRERWRPVGGGWQLEQAQGTNVNQIPTAVDPVISQYEFEIRWQSVTAGSDDLELAGGSLANGSWGISSPAGDVPWELEVTSSLQRAGLTVHKIDGPGSSRGLDGLVCLWDYNADAATQAYELMTKSLQHFQSAASVGSRTPMVWITRNAVGARPDDTAAGLGASTLWGLLRTGRMEHPELRVRIIDLDGRPFTDDTLARALVLGGECEFAIRNGQLLVPRMQRVEALPQLAHHRLLRRDGAVLITGGLGGIGRHIARWLASKHGIRDIVITSRHGMKARGAGDLVAELSELGAKATVVASNIANLAEVQGIMKLFDENRPLRGVVHAAGVLDDGVIQSLTPRRCAATFGPKVDGAWHLHSLTRDMDLDLFMVTSSISGIMGSTGRANYSAANIFLDSLMQMRRSEGLPATSVALGLWGGEGMSGNLSRMERVRYARFGLDPLEPSHGLALFEQAVRSERAVTVAAAYDLDRLQSYYEDRGETPPLFRALLGQEESASLDISGDRDLREVLAEAPETQHVAIALSMVRETVAKTLGFKSPTDLDVDLPLQQVGVDSLTAVMIRNKLVNLTGLSLTPRIVFEHANLSALSRSLLCQIQQEREDTGSSSEDDFGTESPATTWSEESVIDIPDLADARKGTLDPTLTFNRAAPARPDAVFVTGSTGYVGAFVVHDLLKLGIATYCLVRAGSTDEALERQRGILESYGLWEAQYAPLLHPVVGDASKPLLGLTEEDFAELADQVDAICHSASLVDWLKPLDDYIGPNVISTHEVLRLASLGRAKAIHLISSISTVPRYLGLDVPKDGQEYGYSTSKWMAEQMVAAARWRGANASIYRLPFVGASAATGHFRLDRGDFLHNLIAGSAEMDCYPSLDADISIVLPVDYLSKTVVDVMVHNLSQIGKDFDYANARAPSFDRYFELMGVGSKVVSFDVWRARAMAHAVAHPTGSLARIAAMLDDCTSEFAASMFKSPGVGPHVFGGEHNPLPMMDEKTAQKYLGRIQAAQGPS
jgi:reducing polyketide synthase SwnK